MGEITIRNNSFIQSMHNDIQCLSLNNATRPNDRCWFTSKQIQDWAGMNKDTLNRKLEKLVRVGRIVGLQDTTNNIIDIDISNDTNDAISTKVNKIGSGSNLSQTPAADIQIASIKDSRGVPHEMTIYNLNVLNHLAMVELDNEKLNAIANKFSDILSEVETTGQYNVQKQESSYMIDDPIERARIWIKEQEEKRALEAEKKALEAENNELITHNKELSITNDELITENELLRNDHFNTKQAYEQYQSKFPNAPRQALSTMLNKIRKLLCNITNERQSGRRIYKKHVTNKKGDIEWRQEYFFDKDTLQIFLDHVRDNPNYVINIRLK